MPKVFISHSNQNNDETLLIVEGLKRAGFDVWVDYENIRGSADWLCEIQAGIKRCDAVVTIHSKASLGSAWVERECLYAFQLGKPLFTALLDDLRLPLHLVNAQYCDFREDFAAGTKQLAASLTGALSVPESSIVYPNEANAAEANRANFFPYVEQLPGGEIASLVARDLFHWSARVADEAAFGGRVNPGCHVRINLNGRPVTVLSIWAYPKRPAAQIYFDRLAACAPYHRIRARRALLKRLNQILPAEFQLPASKSDRRPSIPLTVLSSAEILGAFKGILAETLAVLRAKQSC
ncbi:MAG: toll/interleukin-1 receptor domain-containing protein [Chloroflexota bacterium]|nr:toll/interleukin-1 receptor domain-containing protein [Chloroflexota bacterium]